MNDVDVLIVGGGPAGSTLAAILLKYRPEARVRILERERFPRFHVGETLVADINVVLDEMGAYPAVDAAGFVRKYGATFRWGAAPEPWHLLFATMEESRTAPGQVQTAYTWHVDRAEYDRILLDTAQRAGAELVIDAAAALVEEDGRVVGARCASGAVHRARWVIDASGQSGLDGSTAERVMDPHLRNIAYWGYYRGLRYEPGLNGTHDRSRAFIVAHPAGWSWCFPIRDDLASVGVITRVGGGGDKPPVAGGAGSAGPPNVGGSSVVGDGAGPSGLDPTGAPALDGRADYVSGPMAGDSRAGGGLGGDAGVVVEGSKTSQEQPASLGPANRGSSSADDPHSTGAGPHLGGAAPDGDRRVVAGPSSETPGPGGATAAGRRAGEGGVSAGGTVDGNGSFRGGEVQAVPRDARTAGAQRGGDTAPPPVGRTPERHFLDAVADCPELAGLLADAQLVPYEVGAPLVHVIRDFSYVAGHMWRPGLVRTGDAAGFVDPILSVGCFLAQSSARHLAYSLATLLGPDSPMDEPTILDAYADHTRDTLEAFRELTWFFYKFNARKDEWWARARELIDSAGLPAQATDRQAFLAFASGFAARRAVHREPNGVFGEPFFADAFRHLIAPVGGAAAGDRGGGGEVGMAPRLQRTDRVRLVGAAVRRPSAVPLDGSGRVIPALRVEVLGAGEPGTSGAALVRRIHVPPTMAPLFDWLDGSADVVALAERLERELGSPEAERATLVRYVRGVVAGLLERGLVER